MNILFIHQNFPGQFQHLAPALAAKGHTVVALTPSNRVKAGVWRGVQVVPYAIQRGNTPGVHPWVLDLETKVVRGEACFKAALLLQQSGFTPDVIVAHPSWGESLFLKNVWPKARLGIYCEFFYHLHGADTNFDPEFNQSTADSACKLQLKNANHLLHLDLADAGVSPTHWQASTFPDWFKPKISVIHDGIDTAAVKPQPAVRLTLNNSLHLTREDEVITFVNRDLEPYRGFHIFMRALPEILRRRPKARVLIVGGNDVSYGARPANGQSWRDIFVNEVKPHIPDADWQRVHFLGKIPYPQFVALLQLSTVHVYLTYPFVLSWSLLEAMSAGCAIVASNTKPLQEVIEHNQTGLLFDFFDTKALAEEVCDLVGKPELRQSMGTKAREFAISQYDLKTICLPRQLGWIDQLASV